MRRLSSLLDEDGGVLMHPFIMGELVLGGLATRKERLFARLPLAPVVPLLASSALLWSLDSALATAARDLEIGLAF